MILVTGATGFLGSELAKQLVDQGEKIVCIKRSNSIIPDLLLPYQASVKWVDADLLDIFALDSALQNITQVYHCAAWVSFKPANKSQIIKTNVEGTANIVNLCNQYGIRLVHVSSIAAIGEAKAGGLITENTHLEETPHESAYAISKYESEMEVWRGIAEGLNAVIVNPSLIIGVNAGTNGTGKLFNTLYKGIKYYPSGSCGLVDVSDVAKSMIKLMNSDIEAQRYIINSGNWLYKDLFTQIAIKLNVKPPKTEVKPWMLNIAWRLLAIRSVVTGKSAPVDKALIRASASNLNYSNVKIIKATGLQFKPVEQTITEICQYFINNIKT